jgi:thioredoxin-like negative regulator of GroEL
MAIGFALLIDLGLLSGRVWIELLSPEAQGMLWLVVAGIWFTAAIVSCRWVARLRPNGQPANGGADLFETARSEYLRGHWFEAETALQRLLDINLLDREARLMLAALLRRTGRFAEAEGQLDRLSRMDGAEKWGLEIARQRARMQQQIADQTEDQNQSASEDENDAAEVAGPIARAA